MIMVTDSVKKLKGYLRHLPLNQYAQEMVLRMMLAFVMRRGRMSCSQAAVAVKTQPIDRSLVTRFLPRKRWKSTDMNAPARRRLLMLEQRRGPFIFAIDATLVGQSGKQAQNTYSTGNKSSGKRKKGKRHHKYKHAQRSCHSFTFGLLITPSGYRIPIQKPHYTKEYCEAHGTQHRTTAEAAADMVDSLEVPKGATVYVIGDTAYDAGVLHEACERKGYLWIVPANPERVYEGPQGQRPKVRNRLDDLGHVSPQQLRMRPSEGDFAEHRRISRWRIGPKTKPRTYSVYQETRTVRSVGRVTLVFSTTKENLQEAKPNELKILMTNATHLGAKAIVDIYSCRWQIELFFKELKSRLGFDQYRLQQFEAVLGWVEIAITTVLMLELRRAEQMANRQLSKQEREWWRVQRLHGLCEAVIQETESNELKFISDRLKTKGGIKKLQRLVNNGSPKEFRSGA